MARRTITELTRSSTAQRLKIDNDPTDSEIVRNLVRLIDAFDLVERVLGRCTINSGYRSIRLNHEVGGSEPPKRSLSYHCFGLAVDFDPPTAMTHDRAQWLLENTAIPFDLLMEEGTAKPESEGGSRWLHLQIAKMGSEPRYMVRDATVDRLGGTITRVTKG